MEQSKATEVLVRAAIVKSLTQIEGVDVVMMTINGEPIKDAAGNNMGLLSADNFVSNPEQLDYYEKMELKLYFANEAGDKLIPIKQKIVHNKKNSYTSMEKLIIEQLIAGPEKNKSVYPTINPATKLLGVSVKDGVCYVNLDSSILTPVNNGLLSCVEVANIV